MATGTVLVNPELGGRDTGWTSFTPRQDELFGSHRGHGLPIPASFWSAWRIRCSAWDRVIERRRIPQKSASAQPGLRQRC